MRVNASGAASASGSATINPYETVVDLFQTAGYGWGTYQWNTGTWGTARTVSNVILDPGNWSLDNFGEALVATVFDGKTFTWDAGASGPRAIRASQTTTNFGTANNPTATEYLLCPIEIDTYFILEQKQLLEHQTLKIRCL